MSRPPNDPPGHPILAATLLMVGITLLLVIIATAGVMT